MFVVLIVEVRLIQFTECLRLLHSLSMTTKKRQYGQSNTPHLRREGEERKGERKGERERERERGRGEEGEREGGERREREREMVRRL